MIIFLKNVKIDLSKLPINYLFKLYTLCIKYFFGGEFMEKKKKICIYATCFSLLICLIFGLGVGFTFMEKSLKYVDKNLENLNANNIESVVCSFDWWDCGPDYAFVKDIKFEHTDKEYLDNFAKTINNMKVQKDLKQVVSGSTINYEINYKDGSNYKFAINTNKIDGHRITTNYDAIYKQDYNLLNKQIDEILG